MRLATVALFFVGIFLVFASSAAAQTVGCGGNGQRACGPEYQPPPDDGGGSFDSCTRTDFCKVCNLDNNRCASVTVDSSCTCTNTPVEGAAPNITNCTEGGQCTYKHVA